MTLRLNRPPRGAEIRGFLAKSITQDLMEIVPDSKIVFDVGAYKGGVTATFLNAFPHATVYAFEPSPAFYAEIVAKSGNIHRLRVENLAITDSIGTAKFHEYSDPQTSSLLEMEPSYQKYMPEECREWRTVDVATVTIDGYCNIEGISMIDLLKLDIQGNELRALKGAENLLKNKAIRAIYLEVLFAPTYFGQGEFHEIQAYLQRLEYNLFDFYNFSYGEDGKLLFGDAVFLPQIA